RRCARRARCRARRRRRGCRPAVAGLRQFRPVQEFRGSRRRFPAGRERHSRGQAHRRECLMFKSRKPKLSRLDRSPVTAWWWTVDRWFLAAFLSLMGLGIVLSFAASPAVAERIGLDSFHFATRQIVYMIPAVLALLAVSFLTPRQIRRFALFLLGAMLLMMVAVLFVGVEVKGAHRWLSLFGVSVQPSEFLKPA